MTEKELFTAYLVKELSTLTNNDIEVWKEAYINHNESNKQFADLAAQAAIYFKNKARG